MLHDEKSFSCPASVASPSAIQGRSQPADFGNIDRNVQQTLPSMNGRRPKQCSTFFRNHPPHQIQPPPQKKIVFFQISPSYSSVFCWCLEKGWPKSTRSPLVPSHLAPQPWRSSLSVRSARLKCWEPRSIRFNGGDVGIATLAGLALGFPTGSFTDLIHLRMFCGASNPYCHDETCCSWSLER